MHRQTSAASHGVISVVVQGARRGEPAWRQRAACGSDEPGGLGTARTKLRGWRPISRGGDEAVLAATKLVLLFCLNKCCCLSYCTIITLKFSKKASLILQKGKNKQTIDLISRLLNPETTYLLQCTPAFSSSNAIQIMQEQQ